VTSGSVRLALIKRLPGILRGPVLGVIQELTRVRRTPRLVALVVMRNRCHRPAQS